MEQAGDLHEVGFAEEERLRGEGFRIVLGLYLFSQRMHSKGLQGNQTRSLPVSM